MNKELNPQKDPNFLLSTMDAQVWATEYCRLNPGADMGNMIGWFANAIMVGFDEATRRKEAERTTSPVSQMTDSTIREIFMAHGFTIKEGQTDLKPYVYAAARALLAAATPKAQAEPMARKIVAWTEKDGDEWVVYDAESDTGQHIAKYQIKDHGVHVFPIYEDCNP